MRRRTFVPLALLLLPLSFSACTPKQESASPVLLRVDGFSLTLADFRRELERTLPPGGALPPEARREVELSFLEELIDRQLVLAEAARLGIALEPGETEDAFAAHRGEYPAVAFEELLRARGMTAEEWRRAFDRRALVEKTIRRQVHSAVEVGDEEIESVFDDRRRDYRRPLQVRLRQIVVAGGAQGKEALERLRRGEPFAEVARRLSLSPDAKEGGDLGFFAKGEMPPVFDAAFALPVGRVSGPVRSEYGFHIFLVEERREAAELPLDQVRDEIRAEVRARKEEEATRKWLRGLRARASVEVNRSLLQGTTPSETDE